ANITQYVIGPNYDRLLPPKIAADKPVFVNVSMFVLNLRSVKAKDLSFTTDLFIHQQWTDYRLLFPENVVDEDDIVLHGSWREKLWIPDMFFKNGIFGDLTTDAFRTTYFKLYRNKTVFMVSRVSVELVCEMDFAKYPHDVHFCNISLMSLSNRNESVVMRWKKFELSKRLFNSDYDIALISTDICDKSYE
ncbi:Glycine receptor subunit alpha-2-like protein, partial [Leptotrombidium deliense]